MAKRFQQSERAAVAKIYAELRQHGYHPHKVFNGQTIVFLVPTIEYPAYTTDPYEEEAHPQRTGYEHGGKRFALVHAMLEKVISPDDAWHYQQMSGKALESIFRNVGNGEVPQAHLLQLQKK